MHYKHTSLKTTQNNKQQKKGKLYVGGIDMERIFLYGITSLKTTSILYGRSIYHHTNQIELK